VKVSWVHLVCIRTEKVVEKYSAVCFVGLESKATSMLGKHSVTRLHPQPAIHISNRKLAFIMNFCFV
jgi:hypothetical protein